MANLKKLFDVTVSNIEGTEYKTKTGKILTPDDKAVVISRSIQAFMHEAGAKKNDDVIIQAFTGSSNLPAMTKDVFNVTNQVNNYDLNWQQAYKGVTLMKGQLNWEIADVTLAAEFELVPEGGKVRFQEYNGSKTVVGIEKYGMGIGVTWETTEGRKLYQFIDQLEQTKSKLYTLWADIHYGLLALAATSNQVAWQGVATDANLERDIMTLNKGYEDLGAATKDSGYGDTANAPMVIYASPKIASRINRALKAALPNVVQSGRVNSGTSVDYPITAIATYNSQIPANKGVLVLPGNKIQNAVYMENLGLRKQDIESLTELRTYWTAFGAIVADTDQCFELAFA